MKKALSKKKILILLIFTIVVVCLLFFVLRNHNKKQSYKIIATKVIIQYEQEQIVEYVIEIKDYKIESAVKEITFNTAEEAEAEYKRYEIINECEQRGYNLELKNKKLTVAMPEKQFKMDINYDDRSNIIMVLEKGKEISVINQEELKQCLIDQDYQIK